nr:hypothetical protein [Anaplasma platys]
MNAVGVVGLAENAVGGNAQRPGDIITSMSKQTIEVLDKEDCCLPMRCSTHKRPFLRNLWSMLLH